MIFFNYTLMNFNENEYKNNYDRILEDNCRLNQIFEDRDITMGDINSSPNFWN